jgi:uncharacterized membrane protein
MVLAAFVGMIDSAYVGFHSQGDTLIPCGPAGGCDEVLNSRYSRWAGISIAWFGFAFYLSVSAGGIFGLSGFQWVFRFTLIASLAAFLVTLYLLYVQAFVLQAFCDYCLLSAFLVFAIFGLHLALRPWKTAGSPQ